MGLSDFIVAHPREILDECEAFARTLLPAAADMDRTALRDHAQQILAAIAEDMKRPQTPSQQDDKAKGRTSPQSSELAAAAGVHGALRADAGFDVSQTTAEYRALRASVIRLWLHTSPALGPHEVDEVTRFNEALDEALATSVLEYARAAAENRDMFLGVLSHELRTPLATIVTSTHAQLRAAAHGAVLPEAAQRVLRSSTRIESLLDNLLDYVRSGVGGGLRVVPTEVRLDDLCDKLVREMQGTHPERRIVLACEGDMAGMWDEERIAQAVTNLLGNALKYGATHAPVRVAVDGRDAERVTVVVHSEGAPIPEDVRASLFMPLVRGGAPDRCGISLGLGLYIVRAIAKAHGGSADLVTSTAEGTAFEIRLPRRSEAFEPAAFAHLRMG